MAAVARALQTRHSRSVPVHPMDRSLLGMRWEGALYIDTALPFGLRSAPKIFNAVADAVEWVARRQGYPRCSTTWVLF